MSDKLSLAPKDAMFPLERTDRPGARMSLFGKPLFRVNKAVLLHQGLLG